MLKSTLSSLFLFCCLLGLQESTEELTAKRGADATLNCSGPKDANILMFKWEKPGLSEGHVIVFRDGEFQPDLQDDSFKGRVELKDPKWNQTGDFSVILKYVTINDTGRYECHAGYGEQKPKLLSSITLKVEEPGQTEEQNKGRGNINGGNKGEEKEKEGKKDVTIGCIVGVLLLVAAVAVVVGFVHRCRKKNRNTSTTQNSPQADSQPHPEDALLGEGKADEDADMNSDSRLRAPMNKEQSGPKEEEHEMPEIHS